MAIWDKLKDGIDKANKVAQEAIDEGKTRMDARKARQAADSAAESLGYAVFRAWENGRELEAESLDRLARALRDHEQEALRLDQAAQEATDWRRKQDAPNAAAEGAGAGGAQETAGTPGGPDAPQAPPADTPPPATAGEPPVRPAGEPPVG